MEALAHKIKGGHEVLALFSARFDKDLPQFLQISEDESLKLAASVSDVMSHYDLSVNPVVMSWVNLAVCCGVVYAPRVIMYRKFKQHEAANQAG